MKVFLLLMTAVWLLPACTFNFEVTSQRTALENQVMGSYRELEDDLILLSSVRGGKAAKAELSPSRKRALDARQNQEFNRDDIDELKELGLLGEAADGHLALLPPGISPGEKSGAKAAKLAHLLVEEENRDRETVWQRIIESNANLSAKDLSSVRKTYAKLQRDTADPKHWVQDESGHWHQGSKAKSVP